MPVEWDVPDTAELGGIAGELVDLYAAVYAEPPYGEGPAEVAGFVARWKTDADRPGLAVVTARDGTGLLGVGYGYPLDDDLPPGLAALGPARLYGAELLVRADARRRGVGRGLHDRLLAGRPERTAALFAHPAATPALTAYGRWGWRRAGTGVPFPGAGEYDVMARARAA